MSGYMKRPICCADHHLEYLDDLRKSGVTNMYGSGEYLQRDFGFGRNDSRAIVLYWMQTFADRHAKGVTS